MTPPEVENLEQTRIVAEKAIEIVQDCRNALGLKKGESLTEAIACLASDRERLLAALALAERERDGAVSVEREACIVAVAAESGPAASRPAIRRAVAAIRARGVAK